MKHELPPSPSEGIYSLAGTPTGRQRAGRHEALHAASFTLSEIPEWERAVAFCLRMSPGALLAPRPPACSLCLPVHHLHSQSPSVGVKENVPGWQWSRCSNNMSCPQSLAPRHQFSGRLARRGCPSHDPCQEVALQHSPVGQSRSPEECIHLAPVTEKMRSMRGES